MGGENLIIYEANETDFFSNGLGTLPDATSALVTEERNGEFVLDVIYPQQGLRSELLTKSRIIKVDAGHELKDQRFVIKKVTPTMDSDGYIYLTVHAEHVSYITADLGVTPNLTLSGNATQALEQWQANLVGGHPDITVDSDIISEHETSLDITKATNARQVLGGVEGSILDTWGGEYKFDNLHISLRGQRGTTANTLISYGRNLLTFEQEDDITDTYTSIYPYANIGLADGNNSKLVTVDGYFVDSQYVDRYPNRKLLPVDFSSEFTDYKIGSKPSESDTGIYTTEAEIKKRLTELAKQYIENNRIGIPKVSTKITFADLSKTSEYAPLEQVNLCDIIPIRFEKLGIDTTIKVTRVVWNVLLDEYDSIELGDLRTTLGESISALESKTTGLANAVITAQSTADNQNSIFRTNGGTAEPVAKKVGDLWFKTDGDYQYMYQWDGAVWHEVVNTKTTDDIAKEVDKAKADAKVLSSEVESAKKQAQEAFAKAGFNADEISNVKTATSEATETLTSTVRQASELSESLKNVASETASRYSTVSSELSGARESLTAKASELAKEIASNSANITKANSQLYSQSEGLAKVSQSATKMEQTMTDLSGRVHTVETTASETKEALADAKGNITTLTKRADGTDTKIADAQGRVQTLENRADSWDLELSKKVDNTTYNAGIQNLGNQINLKANKSDLDGYATKAQLSVESDRITQQAGEIVTVRNLANNANGKIDGLRIGGRNLLKNSDTMDGWYRNQLWTKLSDTRKGCAIWQYTNGRWNGLSTWVYVEKGEIYTFSVDARLVDRESVPAHMYIELNVDNENGYNKATMRYENRSYARNEHTPNLSKEWNRYKVTFVATSDGYVRPRVETDDYATLQISRPKLEEGNVATEWQPSDLDLPDAIISTVTTTTNAEQIVNNSGIYSEVTKLVDTKVGNVITQLDSYKHTVDDTGNKLRDVMGALKLDSNGNLTSNTTELIKTASGVRETYNELSGKIDGIKVGGRNLLDNSSFAAVFDDSTGFHTKWFLVNNGYASWNFDGDVPFKSGNDRSLMVQVKSPGSDTARGIRYSAPLVKANTEYTISFWAKARANGMKIEVESNAKRAQFNLSTSWQRYEGVITFQTDNRDLYIHNFSDGAVGQFLIYHPQLESGNKASDWGLSDNDVMKKVGDVKLTADKASLVVTKLAGLFDVTVGDSSISVTNGGVLVKGKQIHIDGQTLIDNASIDGAKIKSLDAGKITTGTLNAASVKVINLDANNIKTGTLTGPGMALDLNNGSFKINNSDNSLKVEMDSGELRFYRQRNAKALTGTISASDWGFLNDNDQSLNLTGQSGAILKTEDFKMTNTFMTSGWFLTTADVPSSDGSAVILHNNDVKIIGQTNSQISNSRIIMMAGKPYTCKLGGVTSVEYTGVDIIGGEDQSGVVDINGGNEVRISGSKNKINLNLGGSSLVASVANSSNYDDTTRKSEINMREDAIYFNFTKDKEDLTPLALYNGGTVRVKDLSVWGSKNAIVQTTAGWAKINAYETAEYYFGDLGTAITDDTSTARIGIEPLFNETVNTDIPYQVFITAYGEGYAWVAERGSNYFVIKSSVPNLEIGYEIKAKRKGYENVRLEIDEHMEVNKQ